MIEFARYVYVIEQPKNSKKAIIKGEPVWFAFFVWGYEDRMG
jgi:hypothetical protein